MNTRNAISTTHEVILTRALTSAVSRTAAARPAAARYVIQPGDTLSAIAARFAVCGGWLALYAANRDRIGPDPDAIRPGLVLTLAPPPSASPAPRPPGLARPRPAPSTSASPRPSPRPATNPAPAATGMPDWLKTLLVAVGLLILAAFLTEPVLVARRRRHQAANQALPPVRAETSQEPSPRPVGQVPGSRPPVTTGTRAVLADYDRLVVTHNKDDGMVCVLRPPGEDPKAILRAARLVLPEGLYGELAEQLGVTAGWPME